MKTLQFLNIVKGILRFFENFLKFYRNFRENLGKILENFGNMEFSGFGGRSPPPPNRTKLFLKN